MHPLGEGSESTEGTESQERGEEGVSGDAGVNKKETLKKAPRQTITPISRSHPIQFRIEDSGVKVFTKGTSRGFL